MVNVGLSVILRDVCILAVWGNDRIWYVNIIYQVLVFLQFYNESLILDACSFIKDKYAALLLAWDAEVQRRLESDMSI